MGPYDGSQSILLINFLIGSHASEKCSPTSQPMFLHHSVNYLILQMMASGQVEKFKEIKQTRKHRIETPERES